MESIIDYGGRAFNPDVPESSRAQAIRDFDDLIERTKTLNLLSVLNILVRPGHVPAWLRAKLMETLTLVPLRPDGVRATLEFVFSVHPSSTVKVSEAAVPQKRGANITHEALNVASSLLSAPPASVGAETWYAGIAPQLLALLDGGEGPELTKAASYIIGFGILGRKASGAPGTAGWKFLAEPMLHRIKPPPGFSNSLEAGSDGIIDLSKEKILVRHNDLVTALRRLRSLVTSHPNPGLCKRLLSPLLLPLWALSTLHDAQPSLSESIRSPALELLKIYLKLASSPDAVLRLIRNLHYNGGCNEDNPDWTYKCRKEGQVEIVDARQPIATLSPSASTVTLDAIDERIPKLMDIITSAISDADISTAFLELLNRWLTSSRSARGGDISIKQAQNEQDPVAQLAELKTLQAMMEKFPDKLATQPKHILELVSQILASSRDEPDDDDPDVTGVALSLLNMIITAPGFRRARVDGQVLTRIESSLDSISKRRDSDISRTANNLRLLLMYRDEVDAESESATPSAPTDRQIEDRKTYNLAISYITQPDSPAPVRSEGLNLISTLITAQSPVLDIPGILVLLSSLMSDSDDEYVYLRAIKLYTLLADRHPRAVAHELVDHFVDAREAHPLVDARLRFGEALLQVVARLGETFAGDLARHVADALLAVAGRRGRRPKTEARQRREARIRERKNREAAEAWGGEVPDLSEPDEEAGGGLTEEERARNEILAAIVEGWESKRGSEDVRVRASALSVLGAAVETNVAGLGPAVVAAAVDLCVAVLQLERELEKGILRRAAVLFIMSFIRALDGARKAGRRLGFGFGPEAQEDVMRTLRYVAETDNDGLVVQHARDVMESLENWQVVRLLPSDGGGAGQQTPGGGLIKLAGLEVDPERSAALQDDAGSRASKPKIEEVE
ncbi:hypothetical protein VTK56DRAFT_3449 [Thermocarpiscus australiensis]